MNKSCSLGLKPEPFIKIISNNGKVQCSFNDVSDVPSLNVEQVH